MSPESFFRACGPTLSAFSWTLALSAFRDFRRSCPHFSHFAPPPFWTWLHLGHVILRALTAGFARPAGGPLATVQTGGSQGRDEERDECRDQRERPIRRYRIHDQVRYDRHEDRHYDRDERAPRHDGSLPLPQQLSRERLEHGRETREAQLPLRSRQP